MSFVAKLFVVANLILSVVFLTFALNVWTAQTKWRKMFEDEKKFNVLNLAEIQREQVKLAQEVVKQQEIVQARDKDIADKKIELGHLRDDKVTLEADKAKLENDKERAIAASEEVSRENQRHVDDLLKMKGVVLKQQQALITERDNATKARSAAAEMENDLNAAKQTLAAVQRDKRAIEEDLALQTNRIQSLMEKGFPIDRILGTDVSATQPAIADAQVLAVRPDIGLVMISVGTQQNVKPGYQFTISRGDEYISKVQVEKVYPDMCSARVLADMAKAGAEIQIHDDARTR